MLSEKEIRSLIVDNKFIELWLGYHGVLPAMDIDMIFKMCESLGILINNEAYSGAPDMYSARIACFKYVLKNADELNDVFNYCLSKRYIYENLDQKDINDLRLLDSNERREKVNEIYRNKVEEFLDLLNNFLFLDDYEADYNFNDKSIKFTSTSQNVITVNNEVMDFGYLRQLYLTVQSSLKNQDYDSVITKSRTMLEQTFEYILKENQVEFKDNGKLTQYRSAVNKTLGLNPSGSNWKSDDERLRPIKNLVSGMNKIIDSVGEMRDKNSDAHGSLERFTNRKAEAELFLNAAVTLSSYYLRVNQRHKSEG